MKAELQVLPSTIRVTIGDTTDDNFYSFELSDGGIIVGGPFCRVTETTFADVRERLEALLDPTKTC